MALLGSDFIPTDPQNSEAASGAASRIRDVKARLKSFVSIMFNPDTGLLLDKAIKTAMLDDCGTSGTYGTITTDAKGRVVSGSSPVNNVAVGNLNITEVGTTRTFSEIVAPAHGSATLVASVGATPVNVIPDTTVGAKKFYLTGIIAFVNGATVWGSDVRIQDTTGTDLLVIPSANLTANSINYLQSAGITLGSPVLLSSGTGAGKGVQVRSDSNTTGSDLVIQVIGVIK